jgi:hypothetical protein
MKMTVLHQLMHHILPLLGESTLCRTPEEMQEIEKFRYGIYIRELRLRMQADHAGERLADPLDATGLNFYRRNLFGGISATCRVHILSPERQAEREALRHFIESCGMTPLLDEPVVWSYVSRLMASRAWRGVGLVPKLLTDIYHYGRRTYDARLLFCHCNPKLVRLYEKMGLHRSAPSFTIAGREQIPMVLFFDDIEHFRATGSFLYQAAKPYTPDRALLEHLKSTLTLPSRGDYALPRQKRFRGGGSLLGTVTTVEDEDNDSRAMA